MLEWEYFWQDGGGGEGGGGRETESYDRKKAWDSKRILDFPT